VSKIKLDSTKSFSSSSTRSLLAHHLAGGDANDGGFLSELGRELVEDGCSLLDVE
jgi:hypothetical protein